MNNYRLKTGLFFAAWIASCMGALALDDGTYFFKTDDGKFWMRGEPYGSAVQLYDWGLPVNVTTDGSGITTLKFGDASDWLIFSDGTGIYADNANPENKSWLAVESNGKYVFKCKENNHYMKVEESRVLSSENASDAYAFTLISATDHQAILTNLTNTQASTAAASAGLNASTPTALTAAAESLNKSSVITASTPTSTTEKYQGGQWDSRTVYSKKVNILTPGLYKFTMQAFYRMTDNDATFSLHTQNADCPPVYVFFGDAKTPIASVFDASNVSNDNCYTAANGQFYPNGQGAALTAFKAGNYTNTVWVYIAVAGEYTYGIQYLGWAGSHAEWTCYTTESISLTHYYSDEQWENASIDNPIDLTAGIINGADCTSNDAWPGSGRTTATGTYYDGSSRTYFTQNHEDGAARSQTVTIPKVGAYLLRTIVRPVADASYATISLGDESTTTRGIQTGTDNIGNGWAYNDIYFTTTAENTQKTISIALSNVNNNREADCGEMHLYYIGQQADFVKDGVHRYIGKYATAPAIALTDESPVADVTATNITNANVTFTNPNGLVFAKSGQVTNTQNVVIGGICANLVLSEGHPFVNPTIFTATQAKYTISALAGNLFATLVLPFNASAPNGSIFALDQGVDLISGTLKASSVTTTGANTPVLITATGNFSGTNVNVVVVKAQETYTNGELVGVYQSASAPEGSYVLQNHMDGEGVAFYLVGNMKPTVTPFHAYIKTQSSGSRAFRIVFDDEASGIFPASGQEEGVTSYYSLDGLHLPAPQKGINIVRMNNGNLRKVIVK